MWIQYDSTEMGFSSTKIDKRMYTRRKRIDGYFTTKKRILGIQSENMFFFRFTLENSGTIREWLGFDHQAWIGGNE